MKTMQLFSLAFSIHFVVVLRGEHTAVGRYRRKLPLIFHNFSVSQFVCGFGIPIDSELESVTSGIVFKSQVHLPANTNQNRNHIFQNVHARYSSQIRWNFYKALELWANNLGLQGRECVLKSICEANQFPFSQEKGNLWHEISEVLFSPFSSTDEKGGEVSNEYFAAALFGFKFECNNIFWKCPKSLLNIFSTTL
ncbi:uncharacterized protein LOC142240086 [Haematobia irritans]|uniref:uncharacterized protein LOC142240086 n=1 Tax=Haematobia irritans TaxID=7368 RepID=UPI003F4F74D1